MNDDHENSLIYPSDLPGPLQQIARAWLEAWPRDRSVFGPKGRAMTVQAHIEFTAWLQDRLQGEVAKLPMRNITAIDAVVFDAFGTLCEIRDKRNPYARLVRPYGDTAAAIRLIMTQPLTLREAAYQLDFHDEEAIDELEADLAAELASIELYPEVLDVLRGWKALGVKIAVGSNLAMPYAAPLLKLLPFELDAYGWSFQIGARKPDSVFYDWILQALDEGAERDSPDTVLWVGDSLTNDHDGPQGVGMRSVLIRRQRNPHNWSDRPFSRPSMVLPRLPHPDQFWIGDRL